MTTHKLIAPFVAILLITGSVYLSILTRNSLKEYNYIGITNEQRHTISVTGEGKVTGIPDVAQIQLGYNVEKKTVADAQKNATEKMNAMIDKLKKDFQIDEKDIQTSGYNIYPQYDWTTGKQIMRGYQVSENLNVKVRNLDKISDILSVAGTLGLNQVGGLNFEIDNPEKLKQSAREIAITAAKDKADALAKVAGVKLGRIVSFTESGSQPSPNYPIYAMKESMASDSAGAAPQIEAGSTDIVITATVEYEIL
jgi:uncharacterized protein YggE